MVVNLLAHKKEDHGDKEKKIAKIMKPEYSIVNHNWTKTP